MLPSEFMNLRALTQILIAAATFLLVSCGSEFDGSYSGNVNGKEIVLHLEEDKTAQISGYFPDTLEGTWKEEDILGKSAIWVSFDGPTEKPFRLRFELQPEGNGLRVTGIKARPLGKGTKLTPIELKGSPILSPKI
jgi:hypothetical protein